MQTNMHTYIDIYLHTHYAEQTTLIHYYYVLFGEIGMKK